MFSPDNSESDYERVYDALTAIKKLPPIQNLDTYPTVPLRAMTPREAIFSESETVPAELSKGKILSSVSVSCPPAVPIAMSGEIIDENAVKLFEKYGIKNVCVVK
jgi:arginine/lysine/ornithine decarboxylase